MLFTTKKTTKLYISLETLKFLRATMKSTKEKWNTIKISGPATIVKKQGIAFFKAGNRWNLAEKEGVVMGYVIHKGELEIEKLL